MLDRQITGMCVILWLGEQAGTLYIHSGGMRWDVSVATVYPLVDLDGKLAFP